MTLPHLVNEIRDTNLSYLLLAQAMLRSDKAGAPARLGMSPAVADLVAQATPHQLLRVASRNLMLCTLQFDEELVWGLLTEPHVPRDRPTPPRGRASMEPSVAEMDCEDTAQ